MGSESDISFSFSAFTVDAGNPNCNLKSYEVKIGGTNGAALHDELNAPVESPANSGNYKIVPKILNEYKTYEFYIKYTSDDDNVAYSQKKTFIITPPPCQSIVDP